MDKRPYQCDGYAQKDTEKGKSLKHAWLHVDMKKTACFEKILQLASKRVYQLTLIIIASHGWKINCLDIQSAFLQDSCISREIFLTPPVEASKKNL